MTTDQDQAAVDYWRTILNAIDRMLAEIPDTMLTISSYSMDLAGPCSSTEPPLPGGDVLVLTGPWASDATHGDDTPHPTQTIVEWCERIRSHRGAPAVARPRYAEALRYLRDETPWIIESAFATAWCEDLEAVYGRLRSLCPPEVDHRHDSHPTFEDVEQSLAERAGEIPNDARLKLAEVEHAWPGLNLSQRIRTARSKENAKANREEREPHHPLEPDKRGRYRVGDLREHYPETRQKLGATG